MQRHQEGELTFQAQPAPLVSYESKLCENCPRVFIRRTGSKDKFCRACHAQSVMQPVKTPRFD